MPEWVYLANWTPERKTINPARNKPAGWAFWQEFPDCASYRIENWQEYCAWVERWPYYCRECDGWGITSGYDNAAPHGSGEYWPMEVQDLCACLYPGGKDDPMLCPRCEYPLAKFFNFDDDKIEHWLDQMEPCPICNWTWGKDPGDTAPHILEECDCDYNIEPEKPGRWQLLWFRVFGERFQFLFKHPIWIMRGRNE